MSETIVSKWSLGLEKPYQEDIVEQKREIREREAAITYHNEMLIVAKEKLTSLEAENVKAMQKYEEKKSAGDEEQQDG